MPSNITSPTCLHVPPLFRRRAATLQWGKVANATGYQLESVFDGAFGPIDSGKTWRYREFLSKSWRQQETEGQSWRKTETLSPVQVASITAATATTVPGCAPGVSHIKHKVSIPTEAPTALFRVRATATDGVSPYQTSAITTVAAFNLSIEGQRTLSAIAGQEYFVQVNVGKAGEFSDVPLSLTYPTQTLQLQSAYLEDLNSKTDLGNGGTPTAIIQVISHTNGKYQFRCVKQVPEEIDWSGLIVCFRFRGLQNNTATIQLQ